MGFWKRIVPLNGASYGGRQRVNRFARLVCKGLATRTTQLPLPPGLGHTQRARRRRLVRESRLMSPVTWARTGRPNGMRASPQTVPPFISLLKPRKREKHRPPSREALCSAIQFRQRTQQREERLKLEARPSLGRWGSQ